MALHSAPVLQPFILHKVERSGKILGRGSFGTVQEMRYDHAPCAGKIIHEMLVDPVNVGSEKLILKFEQECKLLKELNYPHIVQFMGLAFFDDCKSPVIIMELLHTNIEQLLERKEKELPLSLKCSILRDIAKGLYHLHSHSPCIIHRDLTARNVLLTMSMVAKIADLGNAYIVPPQHLAQTMTRVPGTIPYMPPEAVRPNYPYTEKLDIFSFGHLALYMMIQEEPYYDLLSPTYFDPSEPTIIKGRSELERRKLYLDKLHLKFTSSHDISSMIQHCLDNNPSSRPSASEIINVFDEILKEHKDDYITHDCLNRYDIAEKLREFQDSKDLRGFDASDVLKREKISSNVEKIKSGHTLVLQLYKKKAGIFRKSKWKTYNFCYSSEHFKCYADLNRDPIQEISMSKVESTRLLDGDRVFEMQFKGKEEWILKAPCEEEALAWIEVLKPSGMRKVPQIALPNPPPPPPPPVEDTENAYEPIHAFLEQQQQLQQQQKPEYEEIDPKSRNDPQLYITTHSSVVGSKQPQRTTGLSQAYNQRLEAKRAPTPEINLEESSPEATRNMKEFRRSRNISDEQWDLVIEMMKKITAKPSSLERELNDDIIHVLHSPQHAAPKKPEPWGNVDSDNYVNMDDIDDIYDTVDDVPKLDNTKPPVPPKPWNHPKFLGTDEEEDGGPEYECIPEVVCRQKPQPTQRKKHLTVQHKTPSIDGIKEASSQVSSDMLILYDDVEDDDIYYHRPMWAKASVTVTNTKEIDIYGLDDDIMELLTLDPTRIFNSEAFASGHFGTVYKAFLKTSPGECVKVAVKGVKHETEKEKNNFIREMSVMSKMLHPNIVRLYGLVLQENLIVLEFMPNGNLETFLKENKRPVSKMIMYMLDIALGMHHISHLGLVHRDLAARNVLVDQNETCKVADFGLLREIDNGCYLSTGSSKVPIRWCAPECIQRNKFYPASDVWSYGVVLWETANPTKVPYEECQDYQVCSRVIDEGLRLQIPREYPQTVQQIMQACWRTRPDKRPSFQYITMLLTKVNFNLD